MNARLRRGDFGLSGSDPRLRLLDSRVLKLLLPLVIHQVAFGSMNRGVGLIHRQMGAILGGLAASCILARRW